MLSVGEKMDGWICSSYSLNGRVRNDIEMVVDEGDSHGEIDSLAQSNGPKKSKLIDLLFNAVGGRYNVLTSAELNGVVMGEDSPYIIQRYSLDAVKVEVLVAESDIDFLFADRLSTLG